MALGATHLLDRGVDDLAARDPGLIVAGEANLLIDEELGIVARMREMAVGAAPIGHGGVSHLLHETLRFMTVEAKKGKLA